MSRPVKWQSGHRASSSKAAARSSEKDMLRGSSTNSTVPLKAACVSGHPTYAHTQSAYTCPGRCMASNTKRTALPALGRTDRICGCARL